MTIRLKRNLKRLAPKWASRLWLRYFGWRWFVGSYSNWESARAASKGYDDTVVLERVAAASRAVEEGRGAWERDGFVFAMPQINEPLFRQLRDIAESSEGVLTVLDFGGGLGSTWRQHRSHFADLKRVDWRVVEQPHFVREGIKGFQTEVLTFHLNLEEAIGLDRPSVALLSSVLPYVETPHQLISEIVRLKFKHVIIDRVGFISAAQDILTVQRVPQALGGGSYPAWLFAREGLLRRAFQSYDLVSEWPGFDDVDWRVQFKGFHFRRKL